jgi:beta-glucosidase
MIMVTGPTADAQDVLLGNYNGYSAQMVTILEGIIGKVTAGSRVSFSSGCALNGPAASKFGSLDWDGPRADLIIACVGFSPKLEGEEGEIAESDGSGDRTGLDLPASQVSLLRFVDSLNKPTVLVLTGGSPIQLPDGLRNVRAVLLAWYPGQEGGNAVADVLFGDSNPSGRLPASFPGPGAVLPPIDDYSMEGRTYRFTRERMRFPFGFGLSYTKFQYSALGLSASKLKTGEGIQVECTVRNAGSVPGEEVVQLYLRDLEASVRVPVHRLEGFRRVRLEPGESSAVRFELEAGQLGIVDELGTRRIEPGEFELFVGGGQPFPEDVAEGRVLSGRFEVIE